MSEKKILYHESKFPQEELLSCDAKAFKNFFGDSTIARSMKLLSDGNKTQKRQVLKNIRYWGRFENMEYYVPNTLPFLISILVFDENIGLDTLKTIHNIVNTYKLDLDEETESTIRVNVKKYGNNENISKVVEWIVNPWRKTLLFDSTEKVYQRDLLEMEKSTFPFCL